MKKILSLGAVLTLSLFLLPFTSCEKLVDDASETSQSAEDMGSDMVALSSLTDAIQDIVSSDPNLQLKAGGSFISRQYFSYRGNDSVFTDGDGIVIEFKFEDPRQGSPYSSISFDPSAGTGSVGGDGSIRWGSGRIYMDKPYSDPNCEITLELDRYIVLKEGTYYQIDDGDRRIGSSRELVISRKGTDAWDIEYNYSFRNRKTSEASPSDKSYNVGLFHATFIDGGVEGLLDDEVTLTGVASDCKSRKGVVYSFTVTETLRRVLKKGCSNTFVEGKVELKNAGSKFLVKADFGSGACDDLVEVTLPGNVKKTISIK